MKILALIGACLVFTFAACGGAGSGQTTGRSVAATEEAGEVKEAIAKRKPRRPRGPTVMMSKAEIAKLPPLTIPKPSGSPPRHLEIINLRKGSGPGVPKNDRVTNREEVLVSYFGASYPEARKGPLTGHHAPSQLLLENTTKGLAIGLTGMKVGGRRELILPPKLAYPRWKPSWGYAPYVEIYMVDLLGMEPPPDRRVEYRNRS